MQEKSGDLSLMTLSSQQGNVVLNLENTVSVDMVWLRQNWIISQIYHFCGFIKQDMIITCRLNIFRWSYFIYVYMEMRRGKKDRLKDYWLNLVQVHKYLFICLSFFLTHRSSQQTSLMFD